MDADRRLVLVAAAIGVVAAAAVLLRAALPDAALLTDATALRAWVQAHGVWAPIALMAVQVLQVVVVPLPNQVPAVAAGYLFGVGPGLVYTTVGTLLGSYAAFLLGRWLGRPLLTAFVAPETVDRFDAAATRHGPVALIVMFLLPVFPGDVLCYTAGMSRMRFRTIAAVTLIGRGPKFLVYTVIGARLAAGGAGATLPYVVPLLVLAALATWQRSRLRAALERLDPVARARR